MSERLAYEYALVRALPRVERGECMNVGVVLICRARRFLQARTELDRVRLRAFAPYLDEDTIHGIERQVELIPRICAGDPDAGPIAALPYGERWHWLVAPASTIVQPGPVHTGLLTDPAACLDDLFTKMVSIGDEPAGKEPER
jgi:hypothetical protein